MGIYQDRKGKKFILMLGLVIASIGLLIPIINGMYGPVITTDNLAQGKFLTLLFSIFLLGAGATTLQVAGNPIMRDVSPEGKYASNLSLGQSIKAIGSSMGFLVPPLVGVAFGMDWTMLFPIYLALILITMVLLGITRIEQREREDQQAAASFGSCFKLLKNPYVLMMVAAIFLYVGSEVTMSSQVPILMRDFFKLAKFGLWVSWALFFLPIFLGRFAGSIILRKIKAERFLKITVLISMIGIIILLLGIKILAFIGIIMVGLGFGNIFPLIFSITIDKMPDRSNELSGLMVTAIVGGAFLPPLAGFIADKTSILIGFCVPLAALIYIGWVSLKAGRE
jgi:fucose permease